MKSSKLRFKKNDPNARTEKLSCFHFLFLRELMIGQMQGKFQMVVVPNTGHMLHEVRPCYTLKFVDRLRCGALC